MQNTWAKCLEIAKLVLVFTLLTVFFYGLIVWITDQMEARQENEEPRGRAVKVFSDLDPVLEDMRDVQHRLMFYYWFGE